MKFLIKIMIFVLGFGANAKADPVATHGMLLFGKTNTYASHLPMFHAPHDWQLILKLALQEQIHQNVLTKYAAAKKKGTLFTLVPEPLDLLAMVNGEKTKFPAHIFQGHFEKGGVDLGTVDVKVDKIIYAQKLDPSAQGKESYFIFGQNEEYFAAHLIEGAPSFDTIVQVVHPYKVYQHACRTRLCADPVQTPLPDDKLPLKLDGPYHDVGNNMPVKDQQLGVPSTAVTDILDVLYFEQDELMP